MKIKPRLGCSVSLLSILAPAIIGAALLTGCGTHTDEWLEAKVDSKERTCFKSTDCRYMVYTDKENFEITDQLFGRKNSSDVYGKIKVGNTYKFHVIGYRNPTYTKFRNITEINEIKVTGTTAK